MLDRRSNLLPALFVITELHRVCVTTTTTYRAFTMPVSLSCSLPA
jgi:hypothetical protein